MMFALPLAWLQLSREKLRLAIALAGIAFAIILMFATLKAMGYKDFYLDLVVLQERIILAVLGFIPGFSLSLGLYDFTQKATFLPIAMTFNRAFVVLVLAIVMCCISGLIAVRKLWKIDPADVF